MPCDRRLLNSFSGFALAHKVTAARVASARSGSRWDESRLQSFCGWILLLNTSVQDPFYLLPRAEPAQQGYLLGEISTESLSRIACDLRRLCHSSALSRSGEVKQLISKLISPCCFVPRASNRASAETEAIFMRCNVSMQPRCFTRLPGQ